MVKTKKVYLLVGFLLLIASITVLVNRFPGQGVVDNKEIRIGYFHGGRIFGLYRAYVYDANTHLGNLINYFERENVNVKLYSQNISGEDWFKVPNYHEKMMVKYRANFFGKVTGLKIIDAIEEGILDGGTPGEFSFIQKVAEGSPIVAVAQLGHDTNEAPGKVILLRNDLIINNPEDFKGKTFGVRRAGPADRIFLKEFFRSIGLDPETDVTILDQIPDDLQIALLKSGEIDGSLFHLLAVPRALKEKAGYFYRTMDWINSEISQALLVFRKDFIEEHPEEVEKVVRAYVKRIKYENSLPDEEKGSSEHPGNDLGLQIGFQLKGAKTPIYDYPPLVRVELLKEVQDLLFEYNEIDKKVDLNELIDNSFVEKAMKEIE